MTLKDACIINLFAINFIFLASFELSVYLLRRFKVFMALKDPVVNEVLANNFIYKTQILYKSFYQRLRADNDALSIEVFA